MYVDKSTGRPRPWNDHALDSVGKALHKMQGLTQAAAAGGFAVNDSGGAAMLAAVRDLRAELDGQLAALATLRQSPRLGTTPGALVAGEHVRRSATGDPRSLDAVIEQVGTALDEFESALRKAMANYRETDSGNRAVLHGTHQG